MKKKIIKLISVGLISATLLAACSPTGSSTETTGDAQSTTEQGSTDEGSEPEDASGGDINEALVEDKFELLTTHEEFSTPRSVRVTWFEQGWTGPEDGKDIIRSAIRQKTNLDLEYEARVVPTGDDYTQMLNLMVSSDELPEVFFGGNDAYTRSIYERLGEKGAIWDVSEIIGDYENLSKLLAPELTMYLTADGKNYFIPTQTGRGNEVLNEPPHGTYLRQDILDELGMDLPSSPQELRTYLEQATQLEFDGRNMLGLVLGENLGGLEHLYQAFFPLIGQHETYTLPFDTRNDYKIANYEYSDNPYLVEAAKYVYGLRRDGLLDPEVLTIKQAQVQEKASNASAAGISTAWWDMNTFADNAKEVNPDLVYVSPPTLYASEEIKESRSLPWSNWVGGWSSVFVNKNVDEEGLRHLLATMDYLTTTEGQMLVQAGIEDITYVMNDDGKYEFTDEFKTLTSDLDFNKSAAYGVFYYAQMVFNVPAIRDMQSISPALQREDNYQNWLNQEDVRDLYEADMELTKDYYFLPGPVEQEKFPTIKDAKLEFWASVLTASDEADVERIVSEWGKTCENLGINEIIAEREAIIQTIDVNN